MLSCVLLKAVLKVEKRRTNTARLLLVINAGSLMLFQAWEQQIDPREGLGSALAASAPCTNLALASLPFQPWHCPAWAAVGEGWQVPGPSGLFALGLWVEQSWTYFKLFYSQWGNNFTCVGQDKEALPAPWGPPKEHPFLALCVITGFSSSGKKSSNSGESGSGWAAHRGLARWVKIQGEALALPFPAAPSRSWKISLYENIMVFLPSTTVRVPGPFT